MLLFLMIVFSVVAFTIAIGPVLAMTINEHRAQTRAAVEFARLANDRRGPTVVGARATHDRHLVAGVR